MKLPSLKIGDLTATLPIVLGGMGVGISGPRLAAAIAKEGGIGVISGVGIGFSEPSYFANQVEIDKQALARKIKQARELAPAGILGVNFLVAMNNYAEMVKTAVAEGIDIIISGAGLPTKLPELVAGSKTMIAPIVSSGKAAKLITKYWSKHYNRLPDMVIVEGTMAGGHLGFKEDVLLGENKPLLKDLVSDVIQALKPFSEQYNVKIPVIAAGGIFTGADIVEHLKQALMPCKCQRALSLPQNVMQQRRSKKPTSIVKKKISRSLRAQWVCLVVRLTINSFSRLPIRKKKSPVVIAAYMVVTRQQPLIASPRP